MELFVALLTDLHSGHLDFGVNLILFDFFKENTKVIELQILPNIR